MGDAIQSAIIGAGAAISVMLIKDVIVPIFKSSKAKEEMTKSLTERYAHPLGLAALSLFYRMREMVLLKRFDYLSESARTNDFNKYKYVSSLYRVTSLLGWIRALKLENSHLLQGRNPQSIQIQNLVSGFESSLADGPHVEIDVLKCLATLWGIDLPPDENKLHEIANRCDQARNYVFNGILQEVTAENLFSAVKHVADSICNANNCESIPDDIIMKTITIAKSALTPKQSWIYRDWQAAIGDVMIKESRTPIREFDVIGYADFEQLYEDNNRWIKRMEHIFSGVDFEVNNNDYRPQQVREIFTATARLVLELNGLDIDSRPFTQKNIEDVKKSFIVNHAEHHAIKTPIPTKYVG
jgi:hypothetical protein